MLYCDIIKNTEKAKLAYSKHGYGQDEVYITDEDISALKNGKNLGFCDGEYTHILIYAEAPKRGNAIENSIKLEEATIEQLLKELYKRLKNKKEGK